MAKTKILIVAEKKRAATQTEAAIKRLGYQTAGTVRSVAEAAQPIKKKKIGLLLLHLDQSRQTLEAAEELKQRTGIQIIYLVPETGRALKTASLRKGIDYLIKPIRDHELYFAIASTLKQNPAVSERRFHRFLDFAPVAFIVVDEPGIIQYVNIHTAELLGYTPGQLIGQNFERLIPERFRTAHALNKINYLQGPKKREMGADLNIFCLRADGVELPVEIGLNPVEIDRKKFILASISDISKRKLSEEDLRQAEEKYRTLVEKIPPIIYITGPNQHVGVTYISPRIESLGFNQKEWIADPKLWLRQIHTVDQKRVLLEIEQSTQSGQPFHSEYRLLARDGHVRWFLDEVVDIPGPDGKLLYRQGFMLDITARKQAEESLARREQYLRSLNDLTRTILLSTDFDSLFEALAFDMKKIIAADDCYILRWNEETQQPIPITTTAQLEFEFSTIPVETGRSGITATALQIGHAVAFNDIWDSPAVNSENLKQYPARSIVGVPLIAGGHRLGAALIAFNTLHEFTREEVELAEQAGNQAALALWDFLQGAEIKRKLRESSALARIARALSESERVGTDEVLQLIVDSARELMPRAEKSVIHLLDEEEQVLLARAVSGFGEPEKERQGVKMRLGEGVAGIVIRRGITLNIGDITTDPNYVRGETLPAYRSLLVAPVQTRRQIGTISVQSAEVNAFSAQDSELLYALGTQASIAIENSRLFETTQQSLKEVNALYQISRGLVASLDTDQVISDVIALLQDMFKYYHVQIYLREPDTGRLVIKHGSGSIGHALVGNQYYLNAHEGIVGHVVRTEEPFLTNNVEEVPFYKRNPLLPRTQTEMAVPIKVEHQVLGVLDIQNTLPPRFTEDDFQLMIAVADQLAVALQRASLYTNLQTSLQQEQTIRSQLVQSERLALVGRLLASVSHELNNPLQAIQNALFLLKDEENLSAQGKQDLDVILSEAERMAALIERLRSAYRPIRIKDFQPVQLNSMVEDVYALIATLMRHKEIAFEFFPEAELPSVPGISDQIRQVVLNLFLNATEVMQPGGHLTVQTCHLPEQQEVLLSVTDSGPGIDEEILPHIFEPFITSKHTGTGLGLTITHDIIEQHHGRITAENAASGGAIFSVWLPYG